MIIVLGCRLSQPQTGYNLNLFAPEAKIIYVEIDKNEIKKFGKKVVYSANVDVAKFLDNFLKVITSLKKNFNTFHQFVIRLDLRNELLEFLKKNGVDTMIHYPYMLNELEFYKKNKGSNGLRNSKKLGDKILSLPITEDHSNQEIIYICKTIF